MKYGTDRRPTPVCICMSTQTSAPEAEAEIDTKNMVPEGMAKIALVVPILTGAVVVLAGSLFLLVASPVPGTIAFNAVATTMTGVLVGGTVAVAAYLVASVVAPLFRGDISGRS